MRKRANTRQELQQVKEIRKLEAVVRRSSPWMTERRRLMESHRRYDGKSAGGRAAVKRCLGFERLVNSIVGLLRMIFTGIVRLPLLALHQIAWSTTQGL